MDETTYAKHVKVGDLIKNTHSFEQVVAIHSLVENTVTFSFANGKDKMFLKNETVQKREGNNNAH